MKKHTFLILFLILINITLVYANLNASIQIKTLKDVYFDNEYVNLTDPPRSNFSVGSTSSGTSGSNDVWVPEVSGTPYPLNISKILGLRVDIEDSANCPPGTNDSVQDITTDVPLDTATFANETVAIWVEGKVEKQNACFPPPPLGVQNILMVYFLIITYYSMGMNLD